MGAGMSNYAATNSPNERSTTMPTTTDTATIEKVIFESLETFGAEPTMISREASFEELDVDSLDVAELAQIVQDKFGAEIKSGDVPQIKTVGDAVDLVAERAL
jgi:acyl carrier protein